MFIFQSKTTKSFEKICFFLRDVFIVFIAKHMASLPINHSESTAKRWRRNSHFIVYSPHSAANKHRRKFLKFYCKPGVRHKFSNKLPTANALRTTIIRCAQFLSWRESKINSEANHDHHSATFYRHENLLLPTDEVMFGKPVGIASAQVTLQFTEHSWRKHSCYTRQLVCRCGVFWPHACEKCWWKIQVL